MYVCVILTVFSLQIEEETQVSRATQAEQDHYEMHVRAANIVSKCTATEQTESSLLEIKLLQKQLNSDWYSITPFE